MQHGCAYECSINSRRKCWCVQVLELQAGKARAEAAAARLQRAVVDLRAEKAQQSGAGATQARLQEAGAAAVAELQARPGCCT